LRETFVLSRSSIPFSPRGSGLTIWAPGLTGRAEWESRRSLGEARAAAGESPELDGALAEAGLEERHTLVLEAETPVITAPSGPFGASRAGEGEPRADEIDLEVASEAGELQFVVYQDEDGVTSIHFPDRPPREEAVAARASAPGLCRYRIRMRPPGAGSGPGRKGGDERGWVGSLAKKVLKVIVGKLLAGAVGKAVYGAAHTWESRARRFQGLHRGETAAALLAAEPRSFRDGPPFAAGRALLFLHGTTSSTAGAFQDLLGAEAAVERLWSAYGGRVAGFNHHTLTKTVAENALDLQAALAAEAGSPEIDIICHSRGGLLARVLKELPSSEVARLAGVDTPPIPVRVRVRKVVFVATPNDGTPLADPENIPAALDRLATLVNLLPDAAPTVALGAVLAWAGYTAAAGLEALPGLADQAPGSALLAALDSSVTSLDDYWAVAADYAPGEPLLRAVVDSGVDRLFGKAPNDLVVPTLGVSRFRGTALPASRVECFGQDGGGTVMHTRLFRERGTWEHLEKALLGTSPSP